MLLRELTEELKVEVADLLLSDGRLRVDGVEPRVAKRVCLQRKACFSEGILNFNVFEGFDEVCALGQDRLDAVTEVLNIHLKALLLLGCEVWADIWNIDMFGELSKLLLDKETAVEAS